MHKRRRRWLTVLIILLCLAAIGAGTVFGINGYVKHMAEPYMLTQEEAVELTDVDCVLVLGCGIRQDGSPSPMLADRLKQGIALYDLGAAPKLLMSGDHGRIGYNEVWTMKEYAMDAGVSSEDIFLDHAGFSTYESLYRARDIFCADKIIIVTQEYHLYRALYIARRMGLDAYGVGADYRIYAGQVVREAREILARIKDVGTTILWPEPTYLGEAIPVSGNGDVTHGEKE